MRSVTTKCGFFFNDTATTEIYTLSLHDALPILLIGGRHERHGRGRPVLVGHVRIDRKSTRLNSSHMSISYAVFCLKKKTKSTKNALHLLQPFIFYLPHAALAALPSYPPDRAVST